jgi:hypothetical protein
VVEDSGQMRLGSLMYEASRRPVSMRHEEVTYGRVRLRAGLGIFLDYRLAWRMSAIF